MTQPGRIAIIGAGHVGSTAAYALMLRALFREIVLVDSDRALAEAEAADLSDANALARPARIWAGDYGDAALAQIVVITAGAATQGSEDRLSVAGRSARIITSCVDQLLGAGFEGILLVAANPVDLMTLVALRRSGFPPSRVIGSGTLLDSSRFKQALAERLDVASSSIDAMVVGEHGDSEVAAFSVARIGGVALDRFSPVGEALDHEKIATDVRKAAYRIIKGKGYTSFGVATAIVRICEVIQRGERAVLPVSTLLTGQYGIHDLCLNLPCVLGAGGVEHVLSPSLTEQEVVALQASAATLRNALDAL